RRLVDDDPWFRESDLRPPGRAEGRSQDLQHEHAHGDGPAADRRRDAWAARDGVGRPAVWERWLPAAAANRGDRRWPDPFDRSAASARPVHGIGGYVQPQDLR